MTITPIFLVMMELIKIENGIDFVGTICYNIDKKGGKYSAIRKYISFAYCNPQICG